MKIALAEIRYFTYIPEMKRAAATNPHSDKTLVREQILRSLLASFKIEGIHIPLNTAQAILKKIEVNLEKQR